jgi:hypothetical protein
VETIATMISRIRVHRLVSGFSNTKAITDVELEATPKIHSQSIY